MILYFKRSDSKVMLCFCRRFELKMWPGDKPLPKDVLKQQIAGVYGIFLWGHIPIDDEVVKAAGT